MKEVKRNALVPVTVDLYRNVELAPEWTAGADGHLFGNSKRKIHIIHVAHVDPDGKLMYDQCMRGEIAGGYLLPIDDQGHIGLQKMWRMQAYDPDTFSKEYPRINWQGIGRVSYEAPRGFTLPDETGPSSAPRAANEETGRSVVTVLGSFPHCDNTTFNLHVGTAMIAKMSPNQTGAIDSMEAILTKLKFFTMEEIKNLQANGLLYDGPTRAMIGDIAINFPQLLFPQLVR